jgi:hypothetical protein
MRTTVLDQQGTLRTRVNGGAGDPSPYEAGDPMTDSETLTPLAGRPEISRNGAM